MNPHATKDTLPTQEPPAHLRTFFLPKNPLLTQEAPFHPLARTPFLSKKPLPIQEPPAYTTPLHTQALPPPRTLCLPKDPGQHLFPSTKLTLTD